MNYTVFDRVVVRRQRPLVDILTWTAIAVYAVIASGAVTASKPATTAGSWRGLLSEPGLLVVGHAASTAVAGVLLALSLVAVWRTDAARPVRFAVAVGAVLFPFQAVIGLLLLTGVSISVPVHLLLAAGIFAAVLVALGWTLEGFPAESHHSPDSLTSSEPTGDDSAEEPTESSGEQPTTGRRLAKARAYLELTKPRLMWLLCLLALAGIALAATTGVTPDGVTVVATLAGGVLAVGASGTFNHVAEYEQDQQMERTADRPLATDAIPRRRAAAFGLALVALSMVIMIVLVNVLAATLTFAAIIYYSVVYTVVLKPNTTWNIAIGGGAGALPAVIGWAAVTGSVGVPALVLAALVVVWTPAHFYNLAIVYREDYANAGYPMYPVVSGVSAARRRILLTLGGTLLVAALLLYLSPLGWLFAAVAVAGGAVFLSALVEQCRVRTDAATMRTFHASNTYLGIVLLTIVVEAAVL